MSSTSEEKKKKKEQANLNASITSENGDWQHSCHENDSKSKYGTSNTRNAIGYGATPVKPHWPRSAKVALNFVINYEEGGEMCTLHGDAASECLLSDNGPSTQPYQNERNLNVESMYDYGSRCGFWRLHRLFTSRKIPVTVWAVGMALERNMEVVGAIKQQEDWEVSSHGYRWWDYRNIDENIEREHIQRSIEIHQNLFGKKPAGLYQGKPSINTRRLAVETGGFLYDSDAYNDDLPYFTFDYGGEEKKPHLIIPYSLVENDMLYTAPNGWSKPDDFLNHLKRTLDYLVLEGRAGQPKMMSVGLHCRLSRPGRVAALAEFADYAKSYGREVWITTREDIANHWYENHLPRGCGNPIVPGENGIANYSSYGGNSYASSGNGSGRRDSESSSTSPTEATSSSSRFSFLGNLKAPRNSQEYKDSLKATTKPTSEDIAEEEDVI
ncbi:glycoside hydrolase/deacetylase [Fragilariopsis cylindrus CCMP1102]|uniref:Glycoside hydrolase/deacetylase n=1 Tax=Fragilariopsis cylindrus CCMP1102 TaxID=635003 RepID=A0A1E7F3L3_9STRA|nr:glycoside hydrolase/deacetylase [Fragilariopsis cylindrus CCMP1102]|eukprot:OEU12724.1 glycoside hydrolase/deacetylase [Fragilariopsis cylindrus CCMP1102]